MVDVDKDMQKARIEKEVQQLQQQGAAIQQQRAALDGQLSKIVEQLARKQGVLEFLDKLE